MSYLLAIIAVLALALVAVWFYGRARLHREISRAAEEKAQQLNILAQDRRRLDQAMTQLGKKHRLETLDEQKHFADRDQLDNDWGGGLHAGDAADTAGTAAAGKAGSSGDWGG